MQIQIRTVCGKELKISWTADRDEVKDVAKRLCSEEAAMNVTLETGGGKRVWERRWIRS